MIHLTTRSDLDVATAVFPVTGRRITLARESAKVSGIWAPLLHLSIQAAAHPAIPAYDAIFANITDSVEYAKLSVFGISSRDRTAQRLLVRVEPVDATMQFIMTCRNRDDSGSPWTRVDLSRNVPQPRLRRGFASEKRPPMIEGFTSLSKPENLYPY